MPNSITALTLAAIHFQICKAYEILFTDIFCCMGLTAWTQNRNQTTTYFSVQYSKILSDYTISNNPWALGVGFQINFLDQASIKPILEVTTDLYLMNENVLRLNPDGTIPEKPNDVRAMVNVFTGFAWEPGRSIYLSTRAAQIWQAANFSLESSRLQEYI